MRNRNTLQQWLLSLKAWLFAVADRLFALPAALFGLPARLFTQPARLSWLVQRLPGQPYRERPPFAHGGSPRRVPATGALLRRWPADQGFGFARRGAGLVMPAAIMAALLVIGGVAVMAARSLSSWTRAVSNADLRAAREAAEYGFSEIVGALNTDANAYLWVTKSANWQTLTQDDLDKCAVIAPTAPSANRVAGVASNSSNASQTLPNNSALSYSLTNFTEPQFPPGQANFISGSINNSCTTDTAAAKFGNLKGGSATVEVTGRVTRGGSQIASYKLTRMVHVKWPNDSLANPMLFLGTGSRLNLLDGNMCTTTNTAATSCTGLPVTVIGCLDLEDCLYWNVDLVTNKQRTAYCAPATNDKKYKKGVICNSFQQAADALPIPPVPTNYGDSRTTSSGGWLYPPHISCTTSKSSDYATKISDYQSKCDVTTFNQSTGATLTTTNDVRFDYAPYAYNNKKTPPPSSSATLTTSLVPGCQYNTSTGLPSGATAITCVYRNVTTKSDEMYWRTAYSSTSGKKSKTTTITTPGLPVNLFVRGTLNLSDGGINNNAVSNWAGLRIFGENSGAKNSDGTPNCSSQTVTATTKRGIGIDGAFVWLPNASISYSNASASTAAYTVMWVCKFTGPTSGTAGNFFIINPLSRRGINGGLKATLAGYGGNVNATTYRAYGVSTER
jgi:hypothetical protein